MAVLTTLVDAAGVEVLAGSAIEVNDLLAAGYRFKGTGQVPVEDGADEQTPAAPASAPAGMITPSGASAPPTREGTT
jgi:hypothetical protein